MDHPMIEQIERYGYAETVPFEQEYGKDSLGQEVYVGDEILVYGDHYFLVEPLMLETQEVLEKLGATYEKAQ